MSDTNGTLVERLDQIAGGGFAAMVDGDVEHSVGWFALIEDVDGLDHILRQDNNGGQTVESFDHISIDKTGYIQPAKVRFEELAQQFHADDEDEYLDDEDDFGDDDLEAAIDAVPGHVAGGLLDELRQAERIADADGSNEEEDVIVYDEELGIERYAYGVSTDEQPTESVSLGELTSGISNALMRLDSRTPGTDLYKRLNDRFGPATTPERMDELAKFVHLIVNDAGDVDIVVTIPDALAHYGDHIDEAGGTNAGNVGAMVFSAMCFLVEVYCGLTTERPANALQAIDENVGVMAHSEGMSLDERRAADREEIIELMESYSLRYGIDLYDPELMIPSELNQWPRLVRRSEPDDRENEGFGSDAHIGPSIGQRDDCKHCGLEIEYHGPGADHRAQDNTKGWLDRGGNWRCNDDSHDHEPHAL